MARDHARIGVDIWDDPEWTALTSLQQTVYLALISARGLSYCGVLPLIPARLARVARDLSVRKVTAALDALEAGRFLVIDHDTAEILVRSYVRHDGLLKQPNVTKALVSALRKVDSARIREAVKVELARLLAEQPDARGWGGYRAMDPEGFAELLARASGNPSGNPSRKG